MNWFMVENLLKGMAFYLRLQGKEKEADFVENDLTKRTESEVTARQTMAKAMLLEHINKADELAQAKPVDRSLEQMGKLFVEWLQANRLAYHHHKEYTSRVCASDEDFSPEPPDYDNPIFAELKQHNLAFWENNEKAENLYKTLIQKADEYLASPKGGEDG